MVSMELTDAAAAMRPDTHSATEPLQQKLPPDQAQRPRQEFQVLKRFRPLWLNLVFICCSVAEPRNMNDVIGSKAKCFQKGKQEGTLGFSK